MKTWIFLALMMSLNFNWAQAADKDGPALKFVEAGAEACGEGGGGGAKEFEPPLF
ncbi:MAG: hypothetical protein ACKVKM_05565 [Verrucomicrobiia bacterium]